MTHKNLSTCRTVWNLYIKKNLSFFVWLLRKKIFFQLTLHLYDLMSIWTPRHIVGKRLHLDWHLLVRGVTLLVRGKHFLLHVAYVINTYILYGQTTYLLAKSYWEKKMDSYFIFNTYLCFWMYCRLKLFGQFFKSILKKPLKSQRE